MYYFNGEFLENTNQISVFDRGLLLADGIFETLRATNGMLFALEKHFGRFEKAATFLKIPIPIEFSELKAILLKLLVVNRLDTTDAAIRLTLTRGISERGIGFPASTKPSLLITVAENKPIVQSVKLTQTRFVKNEKSPLSQFKTLHYLDAVLARQEALDQGFDDSLFLNTQGEITCTSTANVFLVKHRQLFTPSLMSGTLPGITRQAICQLAKEQGIELFETKLFIQDLENADEVFITNSLIDIVSVSAFEQKKFLSTTITTQLKNYYHDFKASLLY